MNQAEFNATGQYKYEKPSKELLKEMIETLPVEVIAGSFLFDQEGIGAYHDYDEGEDYISACSEKGVIPHFAYELWYDDRGDQECKLGSLHHSKAAFEKFKDDLYNKLTEDGYVMYDAKLWITTSRRSGIPQNYNAVDTGIQYSGGKKAELILDLSSRDDEDEMKMHKELYDWFTALGEKHNLDVKSRRSGYDEWS
jgi:hypothetical protein